MKTKKAYPSRIGLLASRLSGFPIFGGMISLVLSVAQAQYQGVWFDGQNIDGFDFTNMNLEGTRFSAVNSMQNITLDGANITYANFYYTTNSTVNKGFNEDMLKTTANYQNGDLSNVFLSSAGYRSENVLSGWDLSNLDLRGAWLTTKGNGLLNTNLAGSDIRYANISGLDWAGVTPEQFYETKSYQDKDLTGVNMSGTNFVDSDGSVVWDFKGQNLTDANLWASIFVSKDGSQRVSFEGAIIKNANFGASSAHRNSDFYLQFEQIRETLSYQQKDLGAIGLSDNDLRGWDFKDQNLEGADFYN